VPNLTLLHPGTHILALITLGQKSWSAWGRKRG